MNVAAIILAAGASRRMGSPKALLEWEGQTFLDRWIAMFSEVCNPVVVVLGHDGDVVRAGLRQTHLARLTANPDPDRGMLSSLQCGLHALPDDAQGFLFTPVDQPAVALGTVARLVEAARDGALVAVPCYGGRRGHPVYCSAALIPEFLALPPSAQARDVIRAHREQTRYVDVDDPGIVTDVDYPADYQRLLASARPS